MIPFSQCSTSIFKEEFKFQDLRGNVHIHVATQNVTLLGKVNVEVSPNISKRNTF